MTSLKSAGTEVVKGHYYPSHKPDTVIDNSAVLVEKCAGLLARYRNCGSESIDALEQQISLRVCRKSGCVAGSARTRKQVQRESLYTSYLLELALSVVLIEQVRFCQGVRSL